MTPVKRARHLSIMAIPLESFIDAKSVTICENSISSLVYFKIKIKQDKAKYNIW